MRSNIWIAEDLHEGDCIVCKDENDRTRIFLALRREGIGVSSDTKPVDGKHLPVLNIISTENHRLYHSRDFVESDVK